MHRVIFLPLTAPLAPADANRMRKQNARLHAAEVAAESRPERLSPGQPAGGQRATGRKSVIFSIISVILIIIIGHWLLSAESRPGKESRDSLAGFPPAAL